MEDPVTGPNDLVLLKGLSYLERQRQILCPLAFEAEIMNTPKTFSGGRSSGRTVAMNKEIIRFHRENPGIPVVVVDKDGPTIVGEAQVVAPKQLPS